MPERSSRIFNFRKTPVDPALVRQKLKSLAIFIAYNLFYGLRSGIDNSAHLGGLVAGLLLGAVLPPIVLATMPASISPDNSSDSQESRRNTISITVALCSVAVLSLGAMRIHTVNAPAALYGRAVMLARGSHLDAAIADMQQAVKLEPKLLYGQALLGQWELEQNDAVAAVVPLERALALDEKRHRYRQ